MPEPRLQLRPSRMDLANACPASHHPEEDEPLIDSTDYDVPANGGKAAHDIFSRGIEGKPWTLEEICAKWNVKEVEMKYLAWASAEYAKELPGMFPDVPKWESEKPLSHHTPFRLEGTTDVLGPTRDEKTVAVGDLKTERLEMEHICQMKGYGHMALNAFPKAEKVIAVLFWARDLEKQNWTWTREDLMKWAEDFREKMWDWDGRSYTVGTHCIYCRRHFSCSARQTALRNGYELMRQEKMPVDLTPEQRGEMWNASIQIPNEIKSWRERVKEQVITGGSIDLGGGKELAVIEKGAPPEIDTEKAMKILQAGFNFSDAEFYECCKVGKGSVEAIIGDKAPDRQKGKMRKEVIEQLIEHGALTPKTTMSLTRRKKKETEEE